MKIHQVKIDFNVTVEITRFVYVYIIEAESDRSLFPFRSTGDTSPAHYPNTHNFESSSRRMPCVRHQVAKHQPLQSREA